MAGRKVRIGIDVGGTFTKSVVIDNDTYELIGKAETLTTHDAPEGVAKGVIMVFHQSLKDFDLDPEDVQFIAHSTTQATNSLLEGDVAGVGIIGMGAGFDGLRARSCTHIHDIKLGTGRILRTFHTFCGTGKTPDEETLKKCVEELVSDGAKVMVASEAFGVDDPSNELLAMKVARDMGLPAAGAHEISKLYGLETRTRTAVINASILPKMMETANMTEDSVRKTGIKAPLMIMRGDGGLMDINEMRKRPILTMLSGPSASVAGALMYLRVTDGIFFEVGGTSTNIGVIRAGKPMVKHVELGGHSTFLPSLDVRVLGVAGGSMVRAEDKKIIDVGPRSAHIAGLRYSAFAVTDEIADPEVILIQPKPNDPNDYVAVKCSNGKIFAITNTCAANVLGVAKKGDFAYGNPDAARRAIEALAKRLSLSVEETARRILEVSSAKIKEVIEELILEYKLDKGSTALVGGGGGASALIPFVAKEMDMEYKISDNAEVISSIGVALAMVRDVIERTVIDPTPEDLLRIRREAEEAAIKSGAAPETIDVFIEIDTNKKRVRATALGATELRTKDISKKLTSEEEARSIAAKAMRVDPEIVKKVASSDFFDVYMATVEKKGRLGFGKQQATPIRVLDKRGVVRLSIGNGIVFESVAKRWKEDLTSCCARFSVYDGDSGLGSMIPHTFILHGGHILDLSGLMKADQLFTIASTELKGMKPEDPVVFVFEPR